MNILIILILSYVALVIVATLLAIEHGNLIWETGIFDKTTEIKNKDWIFLFSEDCKSYIIEYWSTPTIGVVQKFIPKNITKKI